ncbi:hypothetical protein H6G06_15405 [Anabaena sphaerica FACHB-251]|uniref:Uncharacterized protein n=1 Tax=Anabaena sphaerica FACHB-251 TaxID=2692883 RepID=A0A927A0F2_9NOST|nr:hypothetical protein [Anabaena sphaerica]MBD2294832.1 hypothetical protein [Anabaena sphaerica FACHB-251]
MVLAINYQWKTRLFKGKEASILKQQLSTTVDKYVPKYKEADAMVESPRITVG